MSDYSRRTFLKGGMLAAGTSLVGFSQLFDYQQLFAQDNGDDVPTILNLAATAESLACTHYYTALTESNIQLTPLERDFILATLDSELYHLEYLNAHGGQSLTSQFYAPLNVYNDRANFGKITQQAETAFIAAYLAANRRIAELGNSLLAATVAQIAITEGVHLALIRQLAGLLPNNTALGEAFYFNTSEVTPVLRPFLEGGEGFRGPKPFPGADAIRSLVGKNTVDPTKPFTELGLVKEG
ncbi:MAG: ferritin-like domain-containing protein [Anaerolineae bacterium]|nr:ferritin-like domain-containing protein [Anaerolineae bacterium]